MNNYKKIQDFVNDMLDYIQKSINKSSFDRTFRARIVKKISDGKYQIEWCGNKYTARSSQSYNENDIVYVCAPMNKWEELFILSA